MTNFLPSVSFRRIARNSLALSVRWLVVMALSLLTSRYVLQALGVDDYGIYQVVGSAVALLSFFCTALTRTSQRFLSCALGEQNNRLPQVFGTCMSVHTMMVVLVIVLSETVGVWLLKTKLQIPVGSEHVALMAYQAAVVALCIRLIAVPYYAAIISHEKMEVYAVINILQAALKLGIAILIAWKQTDRLMLYAWLMTGIVLVENILYVVYCQRHYPETRCHWCSNKGMIHTYMQYSGWMIGGEMAITLNNKGIELLLNVFSSVVANAAIAIATQLRAAVEGVVLCLVNASQPHIMKQYVAGEYKDMNSTIRRTSVLSFYGLLFMALPIGLNMDVVLTLWLGKVPMWCNDFCLLCLGMALANTLYTAQRIAIYATTHVKAYQIAVMLFYLADIILIFLVLHSGWSPVMAVSVKLALNVVMIAVTWFYAKRYVVEYEAGRFLTEVIGKTLPVGVGIVLLCFVLKMNITGIAWQIVWTIFGMVLIALAGYGIGLSGEDRQLVKQWMQQWIKSK